MRDRFRESRPFLGAMIATLASVGLAAPEALANGFHHHHQTSSYYSQTIVTTTTPFPVVVSSLPVIPWSGFLYQPPVITYQPQVITYQPPVIACPPPPPAATTTYPYTFVPSASVGCYSSSNYSSGYSSGKQAGGSLYQGASEAQASAEIEPLLNRNSELLYRIGDRQLLLSLIRQLRNEINRGNNVPRDYLRWFAQDFFRYYLKNIEVRLIDKLIDDLLRGGDLPNPDVREYQFNNASIHVTVHTSGDDDSAPRRSKAPVAIPRDPEMVGASPLTIRVDKLEADLASIKQSLEEIKKALPKP